MTQQDTKVVTVVTAENLQESREATDRLIRWMAPTHDPADDSRFGSHLDDVHNEED